MTAKLLLNSTGASTPSSVCPSDEEIGAFLDHSPTEKDGEWMEEHISRCEACFEVYSAVLKSQLVMAANKEVQTMVWLRRSLVLAAVITFFVVVLNHQPGKATQSMAETRASLINALSGAELVQHVTPPASRFAFEGESAQQTAFRVGVQTADLVISVRSGRAGLIHDFCDQLPEMMRRIEPSGESFRWLADRMRGETVDEEDARRMISEVEAVMRRHDLAYYYDLGLWAEVSRISALSHLASGLRREDVLFFLSQNKSHLLTAEAIQELSEIERRLASRPESEMDYDLITDRFDDFIQLESR